MVTEVMRFMAPVLMLVDKKLDNTQVSRKGVYCRNNMKPSR